MTRTPSFSALAVAAFAFLAGCHPSIDQRGNLPTEAQLKEVKPGLTDKATVTRLLGSPSSVAAFDGDTWYYISQKTQEIAFFKPEVVDQEVLVIAFDKEGVVREIRHRGLEDRIAVVPNPNATPAAGREFSFLEQLIGNFGRFSNSSPTGATSGGGR